MPGKPFADTNVLVYAISPAGPDATKGAIAASLLQSGDFCISTQVLGEFYNAVTAARRKVPLSHEEALVWVQFWKRYELQSITSAHVDLALEIAGHFCISYYDALIVATTRLAECTVIYSEDLSDTQNYDGIRVENPFRNGAP